MSAFFFMALALTMMAAGAVVLIRKNVGWHYRGVLFILASCLYFVSLFALAQFTLSGSVRAKAVEYAAEIVYKGGTITSKYLEQVVIPVSVKNVGTKTWDSHAEDGPVFMSYHVMTPDGAMVSYDNPRTAFHDVVAPGTAASLEITLHPLPAGIYRIRLDLVAENITWFQEQGTRVVDIDLTISERARDD